MKQNKKLSKADLRYAELTNLLARLERQVAQRPLEVRHVHEAPPKPRVVELTFIGTHGVHRWNLMEGQSTDLPRYLTCEQPRRWWRRSKRPTDPPIRVQVDRFV